MVYPCASSGTAVPLIVHLPRSKELEELQGTGGKLIKTSLTHDEEAKLQAVLDNARATAAGEA